MIEIRFRDTGAGIVAGSSGTYLRAVLYHQG